MKAIINVSKGSAYSKFNGHTFEVAEMFSSGISIKGLNTEFPENKTDFSFAEIFIVDLQKEVETSVKNSKITSSNVLAIQGKLKLNCLLQYCSEKGFELDFKFQTTE